MKKYIFKTKRNKGNKNVMTYKRNYKLLKAVTKYKEFLINTKSALKNENGEYDVKLALAHMQKNMEMLNSVLNIKYQKGIK